MWASHKENFSPELEAATTAEDAARFGKFLGNLKLADARNALEVPLRPSHHLLSQTPTCIGIIIMMIE